MNSAIKILTHQKMILQDQLTIVNEHIKISQESIIANGKIKAEVYIEIIELEEAILALERE